MFASGLSNTPVSTPTNSSPSTAETNQTRNFSIPQESSEGSNSTPTGRLSACYRGLRSVCSQFGGYTNRLMPSISCCHGQNIEIIEHPIHQSAATASSSTPETLPVSSRPIPTADASAQRRGNLAAILDTLDLDNVSLDSDSDFEFDPLDPPPRQPLSIAQRAKQIPQVSIDPLTIDRLNDALGGEAVFHGMMNPFHGKTLEVGEKLLATIICDDHLGKPLTENSNQLTHKFYCSSLETRNFSPNGYGPIAAIFNESKKDTSTSIKTDDVAIFMVPDAASKARVKELVLAARPDRADLMDTKLLTYDELNTDYGQP